MSQDSVFYNYVSHGGRPAKMNIPTTEEISIEARKRFKRKLESIIAEQSEKVQKNKSYDVKTVNQGHDYCAELLTLTQKNGLPKPVYSYSLEGVCTVQVYSIAGGTSMWEEGQGHTNEESAQQAAEKLLQAKTMVSWLSTPSDAEESELDSGDDVTEESDSDTEWPPYEPPTSGLLTLLTIVFFILLGAWFISAREATEPDWNNDCHSPSYERCCLFGQNVTKTLCPHLTPPGQARY